MKPIVYNIFSTRPVLFILYLSSSHMLNINFEFTFESKHSLKQIIFWWRLDVVGYEGGNHEAVNSNDTRHNDRDDGFHDEFRAHHRHSRNTRA